MTRSYFRKIENRTATYILKINIIIDTVLSIFIAVGT